MIHEVGGELARGLAAVLETPYDTPCVTSVVDLHDAQAVGWVQWYIAHELARPGGQKVLVAKIVRLHAHRRPWAIEGKFTLACRNIFIGQAVGEVTAVCFMPTLVEPIFTHPHKGAQEGLLLY